MMCSVAPIDAYEIKQPSKGDWINCGDLSVLCRAELFFSRCLR